MKRITVKISDQLDARLRHEASRRRMTISEVIREALEAHLGEAGDGGTRPRQLMAAGTFRSGRSDVARRIEEILAADAGQFRS